MVSRRNAHRIDSIKSAMSTFNAIKRKKVTYTGKKIIEIRQAAFAPILI